MHLLIRTDATARIGTGHVMRCLALAQAWQMDGGTVQFAMADATPALEDRLRKEGIPLHRLTTSPGSAADSARTSALAQEVGASWIVVDGYQFGASYQEVIKRCGLSLLFLDDYGQSEYYCADLVLNQNIGTNESLYVNRASANALLLGTQYVLLRREFWPWRNWRRDVASSTREILITLGGSDPDNVTSEVIRAFRHLGACTAQATVILGGSSPHLEALRTEVGNQDSYIRLEQDVSDMAVPMARADICISAAGSTSWELAFMGVPSILIVLANNQRPVAEELEKRGVALSLGWHRHLRSPQIEQAVVQLMGSAEQRAKLSLQGQDLIDGYGVERVLMRMRGQNVRLRSACENDAHLLWKWANDPTARAASFSSDPIPWEQHLRWLQEKLDDPGCFLYIAINEREIPVGQVRYDVDSREATVSISIDTEYRGIGYGGMIIELASRIFSQASGVQLVHSHVKPDNEASIRAFLRAGFKNTGLVTGEPSYVHLILSKGATS